MTEYIINDHDLDILARGHEACDTREDLVRLEELLGPNGRHGLKEVVRCRDCVRWKAMTPCFENDLRTCRLFWCLIPSDAFCFWGAGIKWNEDALREIVSSPAIQKAVQQKADEIAKSMEDTDEQALHAVSR